MNSLSWLIYLADSLPNLAVVIRVGAILAAICAIALFVWGCILRDMAGYGEAGKEEREAGIASQKRAIFKAAPIALALAAFSTLVPGKSAILMIAASEMGETVVKTPEAQEIFADMKAILKKQLEELKK